ncbi:MAG: hypothetical protein HN855_10550 [Anaerolineae bacterium]|jgi:hypothetical protein|nr:hypothetical protein [Anaerolineae bacterium]MBT7325591.1 hypothetical protein [Anaerolineae bacterium]
MNSIWKFLLALILASILSACGNEKDDVIPTPTVILEDTQTEVLKIDKPFQPPNLPGDSTRLVRASAGCSPCHTGLDNGEGIDYSFDTNWRSSMMAHSGKDPYWLATMSSEINQHNQHKALIEDKCSTCHMPLAHFDAKVNEYPIEVLGDGFLDPAHPLHDLAADGVSCTLCHQIKADNLGQETSFSGGYVINTEMLTRIAYGSHSAPPEPELIMVTRSGFVPRYSEHVLESALCATCHSLYTPYLDAHGEIAGYFPEQTVFQEWENSAYNGTQSCQECHMPKVVGYVAASTEWGPLSSFTRLHSFAGANLFMLRLLNANAQSVNLTAEDAQMQATIERVTEQLQTNSAELTLDILSIEEGMLTAEVAIHPLTGHKFPSGYPSRRVWLHLTITDETDNILFESGAVEANGLIIGNDNDADPTQYEPHYAQITTPDQVQIYESIMLDIEDQVTTGLLLGAAYAKDNRLLPDGFDITTASPDIAPYGVAGKDSDFSASGDTVVYEIVLQQPPSTLTVSVELLYQSIGYRWIENLRGYDTSETRQFFTLYETVDNLPVVVAEVMQTITP